MSTFVLFCLVLFVKPGNIFGILDTAKNPFQYLEEKNYYYENHTVVTTDGYKLLLVRIPHHRNNISTSCRVPPPILFVHGLVSSFFDFLATGSRVAFGFKAMDEGYDVFLLNTRGNRWSRRHITLDPDINASQFWNYSFHEVGIYDLSATIDYIINLTGFSKISYVGYSYGATCLLVLTSTIPDYNKKLKVAVLLGPVAYLDHERFLLFTLLKNSAREVEVLAEILQLNELVPYVPLISDLGQLACNEQSILLPVCTFFYELLGGSSSQMNRSMIATYLANYPAGGSVKEFIHYLQVSKSGRFQLYDFGKNGNIVEYGQPIPPEYNLSAVSTPTALFYGDSDTFIDRRDILKLIRKLPNIIKNILISNPRTNHFDILVGIKAQELITEPALKLLNEYNVT